MPRKNEKEMLTSVSLAMRSLVCTDHAAHPMYVTADTPPTNPSARKMDGGGVRRMRRALFTSARCKRDTRAEHREVVCNVRPTHVEKSIRKVQHAAHAGMTRPSRPMMCSMHAPIGAYPSGSDMLGRTWRAWLMAYDSTRSARSSIAPNHEYCGE